MRSVTQKELARHLGLSQATVSRALGNDHQITRETRERVREAAEKLGYRPSVALASFHSKEHWTNRELRGAPIAVLFHTGREASGMGGHDSLERQAGERGFRLQWMDVGDPKLRCGLGRRLFNQGFQGILFAPIRGIPDDWMAELDTSRFALAAIDRRMAEFGITAFHGAVRRTVAETLSMMRERGYERIGAALWNLKDHPDHMNRIAAFLAAQFQATGELATDLLLPTEPLGLVPFAKQKRRFQAWVRRVRPDAVLLSTPVEWEWLREVDPRIACASALMQSDEARRKGLAGHHVDYEQLSRLAIRHLENNIRLHHYGPEPRPVVVSVAGIWHEGDSLPPRGEGSCLRLRSDQESSPSLGGGCGVLSCLLNHGWHGWARMEGFELEMERWHQGAARFPGLSEVEGSRRSVWWVGSSRPVGRRTAAKARGSVWSGALQPP